MGDRSHAPHCLAQETYLQHTDTEISQTSKRQSQDLNPGLLGSKAQAIPNILPETLPESVASMPLPPPVPRGQGLVASTHQDRAPNRVRVSSLFSLLHSAAKATNPQSNKGIPLLRDLCCPRVGLGALTDPWVSQAPARSLLLPSLQSKPTCSTLQTDGPAWNQPCSPQSHLLARTVPVARKAFPSSLWNSRCSTRVVLLLIPLAPPLQPLPHWGMTFAQS